MPRLLLPEIKLRAADVVPPTVLFDASRSTPFPLPSTEVPAALVPTKLPNTWLPPPDGPRMEMPVLLPEMRLHAPVQEPPGVVPVVPPTLLFVAPPSIPTPSALPSPAVPVTSVPMKLPSTWLLVLVLPV